MPPRTAWSRYIRPPTLANNSRHGDTHGINTWHQSGARHSWLQAKAGICPPLDITLIVGGHSNLTYKIVDAMGRQFVLRRPPLGNVLATAHDMGREHRIVSSLAASDVPVPTTIGYCDDVAVNGAPFYVMDFVDGIVARNTHAAEKIHETARVTACGNLIDVLARLHRTSPEAVGLGTLGKKADYIARQLRRWLRQVNSLSGRDFSALRRVHAMLQESIPPQTHSSIVHGDFRLDNCITSEDGEIKAVLDWELCTLGEPRADLGILLAYWVEAEDTLHPLRDPPTIAKGYASRSQLIRWYADASGQDTERLHAEFFYAFANWRLACILEGVYARYKVGAMGSILKI